MLKPDNQNDTSSQDEYQKVVRCANYIRGKTATVPEVAIVLGSGLSSFIDGIDIEVKIPYSEMDGFPTSTVEGHNGNFIIGTLSGHKVIVMDGRVHYYEGYSPQDVVLPIRVMHELGAGSLIITNAAGTLHDPSEGKYAPGTFMLLSDHISLVPSPLIGRNISELGQRFVPMNGTYDENMRNAVMRIAEEKGLTMAEGTYIQVAGPQYETPAEIKMYQGFGGDAIGMSTAIEAIAAQHMGMSICGISCLTNYGAGLGG